MEEVIDYKKLGLKIKEVRKSKGMTQDEIARAVFCNVSHISNIENNHTKVSLNVLFAISNTLNTTIDYLLSNQYFEKKEPLNNQILKELENCNDEKKEKILKIISIL